MGGAVLSKSLIQFAVDGQGCVPSLLFDMRPNYGGGDADNVCHIILCATTKTQQSQINK